MEKYILKLIDADIAIIEHRIVSWHKTLSNVKDLAYATRQYKAYSNNLKKAFARRKQFLNLTKNSNGSKK